MCTAISYASRFFGRNLDVIAPFGESVILLPRKYKLTYTKRRECTEHRAIIGIGTLIDGVPLLYDGANEDGLFVAALNFVGNAVYHKEAEGFINLAHFELIPYILSTCGSVREARAQLSKINITDAAFKRGMERAQLHWFITDKNESIAVEPMLDGLAVYDNPCGVLTNNPPFPFHLQNVNYYLNLGAYNAENRIAPSLNLKPTSRGLSAVGLPGDFSSHSRFVRAVYVKSNAVGESLTDAFHTLSSATQYKGCVKAENGFQYTLYTAVFDAEERAYYYNTYSDFSIRSVKLVHDGEDMKIYSILSPPTQQAEQKSTKQA